MEVKPSDADPSITRFDYASYVLLNQDQDPSTALVVFMPGTGGDPKNTLPMLRIVAGLGYRVVDLEYNNEPSVALQCRKSAPINCAGNFRDVRVFGGFVDGVAENTRAESIVGRLVSLLVYLQVQHPLQQWNQFLVAGQPNWNRTVLSGFSQGAGMAAYLAKRQEVLRVVLFSSPWDFDEAAGNSAKWLSQVGETPPNRWFAEFHQRETTANLLKRAYAALGIPRQNILIFDSPLPMELIHRSNNPYHSSTVLLPEYSKKWTLMFGRPNE
jgi:hypothetical protein